MDGEDTVGPMGEESVPNKERNSSARLADILPIEKVRIKGRQPAGVPPCLFSYTHANRSVCPGVLVAQSDGITALVRTAESH